MAFFWRECAKRHGIEEQGDAGRMSNWTRQRERKTMQSGYWWFIKPPNSALIICGRCPSWLSVLNRTVEGRNSWQEKSKSKIYSLLNRIAEEKKEPEGCWVTESPGHKIKCLNLISRLLFSIVWQGQPQWLLREHRRTYFNSFILIYKLSVISTTSINTSDFTDTIA